MVTCPQRSKLAALLKDEENGGPSMHGEDKIMGSMHFLGATQGREEQPKLKGKGRLLPRWVKKTW